MGYVISITSVPVYSIVAVKCVLSNQTLIYSTCEVRNSHG